MTASEAVEGELCEPLFELFSGARGKVSVGRLLTGTDAGRVILLRQVASDLTRLPAAVDVARGLVHPRFCKVLGLVRDKAARYVASEYMPGVSLFELSAVVLEQRTPVRANVVARILREALHAVAVAQPLLRDHAGTGYTRAFHTDTVWLAEYGDVLLLEVGLAPYLNQDWAARSTAEAALRDVMTAAVAGVQLLTAAPLSMELGPKLGDVGEPELNDLLQKALTKPQTFDGPEALAQALSALPASLFASEQQVADELKRLLRPALEKRRQTLSALQASSAESSSDERTQFFRADALLETTTRETTRPPSEGQLIPSALAAPSRDWQDAPTKWEVPRHGRQPPLSAPPTPYPPAKTAELARSAHEDSMAHAAEFPRPVRGLPSSPVLETGPALDLEALSAQRRGFVSWRVFAGLLFLLVAGGAFTAWYQPDWAPHLFGR